MGIVNIMDNASIVFSMFLIFSGAAILSTLALFTRQSLLVAYMLLGMIIGPWGIALIADLRHIQQIGDIGIIFLLFLLGLNLHPQNLLHMLRKVVSIALFSSLIFGMLGFAVGYMAGFTQTESLVIAAAMMFSSTIIGLKLLPTTILHHQHTGELMISVLLMQDIIAIVVLLLLHGAGGEGLGLREVMLILLGFPGLILFAFLVERFVLVKLFSRFDQIQEYIFLIAVGWCLGMAELARIIGLSDEIGAFIAGVSIAASPIALYIAESLKPLRDFFLVLFFFAIGASFNFSYALTLAVPALLLAGVALLVKPVVFRYLFGRTNESSHVGWEVGFRLGQISEFSLLVAYVAIENELISVSASYLIQAATILTFVASSYIVVMKYPTPLAFSEKMRRD